MNALATHTPTIIVATAGSHRARSLAPIARGISSSLVIALLLLSGTASAMGQGAPAATPPAPSPSPSPSPSPAPPRPPSPPVFNSPPNLYITPTTPPALVGPGYNRPPVRNISPPRVIRRNPERGFTPGGPIVIGGDTVYPHAAPYVDRSGVSIRGDFATDNFRIGFSVNSPNVYFRRHWADGYAGPRYVSRCRPNELISPIGFRVWDNYYYNSYDPVYGTYSELDPRVNPDLKPTTATPANPGSMTPGQPAQIVPAPSAPQQPIIISAFDRGVLAIRASEFEASANALREHLRAFPRDVVAMRLLSLALIGQREPAEGVALLVMAYQLDPTLAYRPVSVEFENSSDSRAALSRVSEFAVAFAQKTGTSSSWLAAIVTLQGLDRKAPASRLLKRAEDNGLEARIADELRKALR